MKHYTQPELVNKPWTTPTPHDKAASLSRGKRLSGQTKKVQAMVAKLKLPPKMRWW